MSITSGHLMDEKDHGPRFIQASGRYYNWFILFFSSVGPPRPMDARVDFLDRDFLIVDINMKWYLIVPGQTQKYSPSTLCKLLNCIPLLLLITTE